MANEIETTEVEGELTRIDNAWACERCGAIFVGEHFSADHCNETGEDLSLCFQCCELANAERGDVWEIKRNQKTSMWEVRRDGELIGESSHRDMAARLLMREEP